MPCGIAGKACEATVCAPRRAHVHSATHSRAVHLCLPSVTRIHIHTHRDNRYSKPTGPAHWFHMEKLKIDMWTADYKSTRLKLNCAKSIAVQIPSWMPLILIINLLARSHKEAHIPATTGLKLWRSTASEREREKQRERERAKDNAVMGFALCQWCGETCGDNRKKLWCALVGIG